MNNYLHKQINDRLYRILKDISSDFHHELMSRKTKIARDNYVYLEKDRNIHQRVIKEADVGIIPAEYDIKPKFDSHINYLEDKIADANTSQIRKMKNRISLIKNIHAELEKFIHNNADSIVFSYTDEYLRVVSFRTFNRDTGESKTIRPFNKSGVFGFNFFVPADPYAPIPFKDAMIVTRSEFDLLQLQSLLLRNHLLFWNASAIGDDLSADIETVSKCSTESFRINVTPDLMLDLAHDEQLSDYSLDGLIRSLNDDYSEALQAVKRSWQNSVMITA